MLQIGCEVRAKLIKEKEFLNNVFGHSIKYSIKLIKFLGDNKIKFFGHFIRFSDVK